MFLSFANNKSIWVKIGEYDVPDSSAFTLTADIKNMVLLYNNAPVGSLSNISLQDFKFRDSFYMGYGCHFTHTETDVYVSVTPVPEPATMLFFGSSLIGLVGLRRKLKV
jgi:hypothetical protein